MSTFNAFFVGRTEFRVQGLPQTCLNKLRVFRISNIRIQNDIILFSVASVHVTAIKKLINNFEYTVKENYNLVRGINFLLNRLTLVCSVIVAIVVFLLADMRIYSVKIQCDNLDLMPAIQERLNMLGVEKYMWKSKLNNFNLAADLIENFDDVAHAHVKVAGNTLVVDLVSVNNAAHKQKTNYYAQYDAVIKEITVYSGTAMVSAGDVVKKGDLLVANAYPDSVVVTGEVAFKNGEEISRLVIWLV